MHKSVVGKGQVSGASDTDVEWGEKTNKGQIM